MATGKFVCQHPGMYIFTATVFRNAGSTEASCYIHVNGSKKLRVFANDYDAGSGYTSGSGTLVIHLRAGDDVHLGDCSATDMYYESSFSGVLVQPDVI